jgi:hypothetical protein
MAKTSLLDTRSLLEGAGYRVLQRSHQWAECFVQRATDRREDAERWEGRGETEDEALDSALRQMFPSHFAWELFEQLRAGTLEPRPETGAARITEAIAEAQAPAEAPGELVYYPADARERPPTAPAEDAPDELRLPLQGAPEAPTPETVASPAPALVAEAAAPPELVPAAASAPAPAVASTAAAAQDTAQATTATPAPVEDRPALKVVSAPAAAPEPRRSVISVNEGGVERPVRMRTSEALDVVERLLAEIEDRLGHLARMSSERQRLHMLVWICRARAVEEAQPGAREVEHAVARVARRLTEIGKMFWPGSVRALQLSARPADVRREMHASWASEPSTWQEATGLAERLLAEHLTKSADAGLDEDGWSDAAARAPRPPDPDALLEEVDTELKTMLAPLAEGPSGRGDLSGAEIDQLITASRKLRWLRGAVRDDLAWGMAVGRIRRSLPGFGERSSRVRDVLDHRIKPSAPWAKLLGETVDEPITASGESPATLKAALPAAIVTQADFLAWLIRAFDAINTPDLVDLLRPLKGHSVTQFSEETLNHPDRRIRRRLRDLVKKLDEVPTPKVVAAPKEADDDAPSDEPIAAHALAALAAKVRAQTQDRRALFVSNREDPELGARLTDLLGITITWCDGSLRRVQAQCERISRGSYDLVLSATGFQVHGVDSALARASSAASIPYVRVNRGRPVACVQAIAREFGLTTGTYPVSTLKASSAK